MLHFLLTHWPLFLLLYLPRLAQQASVVVATRTRDTLDRAIPDELPLTAGEWLARRLRSLRLPVEAVVTDKHSNGYSPLGKLILLTDTTHFKADPVYWATAAHELGHARIRHELPLVGWLRSLGNYVLTPAIAVAVGAFAGYVLYGDALAGRLAFAGFAVAAATRVFVLLDEALASVLAYRELRADDAIDFVHLRAIRRVLVACFATYVATYGAFALLLAWWPAIAGPATAVELTSIGYGLAVLLTIGCVASLLLALVEVFARDELRAFLDRHVWLLVAAVVVRYIPIALLVGLAWDVRVDPQYAWCVIAACAASWRVWTHLVYVPFAIPFVVVATIVGRFRGPGMERSTRFTRALLAGRALVRAGNERIANHVKHWRAHPLFLDRVGPLEKLAMLPLLVAFWLSV